VATSTTDAQRSRIFLNDVPVRAIDAGVSFEAVRAPGTFHARPTVTAEAAAVAGNGASRNTRPVAPDRILVRFRPETSPASRSAAVRSVSRGAVIAARPSYADFDIVRLAEGDDPEVVAAALKARQGAVVANAQAAYRWRTMSVPNDPLYRDFQWHLPMINLEPAWDIQPAAGSDITVAVLDTGMAFTSRVITADLPAFIFEGLLYPRLGVVTIPYAGAPQLVGGARAARIVAPFDFIWENASPLDFDGHGTHVSGTIGQISNDNVGTAGVAFNVNLMPVKVIDSFWDELLGAPNFPSDDVVARGIRYAVDRGARVLNLSIGRSGPPAFVVEDAIRYAVGRGAFVSVAAGNEFLDGNPTSVLAEIASRVNGAVSVGAVDRNRGHAPYSSAGAYVELAAPGGSGFAAGFPGIGSYVVQQTFDLDLTYTYLNGPSQFRAPRFDVHRYVGFFGTSMAAPHVTGAAALLMQQGITSPAAIEDALKRSAVDLGQAGRDHLFGHGLINVRNAMFGIGAAR
jgi:serine protease